MQRAWLEFVVTLSPLLLLILGDTNASTRDVKITISKLNGNHLVPFMKKSSSLKKHKHA